MHVLISDLANQAGETFSQSNFQLSLIEAEYETLWKCPDRIMCRAPFKAYQMTTSLPLEGDPIPASLETPLSYRKPSLG